MATFVIGFDVYITVKYSLAIIETLYKLRHLSNKSFVEQISNVKQLKIMTMVAVLSFKYHRKTIKTGEALLCGANVRPQRRH